MSGRVRECVRERGRVNVSAWVSVGGARGSESSCSWIGQDSPVLGESTLSLRSTPLLCRGASGWTLLRLRAGGMGFHEQGNGKDTHAAHLPCLSRDGSRRSTLRRSNRSV